MDTDAARDILTGERERIVSDLAQLREGRGGDGSARLDQGPDDAVATYAHELDEGLEVELQGSLDEVDAALARIGDGSYGTCVDCGQPIAESRLAAVPSAARCIDCQRAREHR